MAEPPILRGPVPPHALPATAGDPGEIVLDGVGYTKFRIPVSGVYFIEDGLGHVKIGWSACVGDRLAALQASNPQKLRVLAIARGQTKTHESEYHRRWASLRLRGEWFALTDELRDFIRGLRNG